MRLGSTSLAGFAPLGREKFSDLAGRQGGQAPKNIREVFLRADAMTAAALDEGVDNSAAGCADQACPVSSPDLFGGWPGNKLENRP